MQIVIALRQAKTEALIGNSILSISSVNLITHEPGLIAKVFATLLAISAHTTGPPKPGDP
ncbi:MAG: hypothetical protein AUI36_19055 [Cyanobacteria bacterium 13_1_40CM_2_61_4]|nr:MAG: hypothetical protein AUI36_19055 [Cyanobacteria bacterium 13_1_40CM_2_61_4]